MIPHGTKRGFTLTELLVVVAVIGILMSLLIVCVDALYVHAMQLKCQHRMEQIWYACQTYANANNGDLPSAFNHETGKAWYETLTDERYLDNIAVTECPSSEIAAAAGAAGYIPGGLADAQAAVAKVLNWMNNHTVPHSATGGIYWNAGSTERYEMDYGEEARPGSVALGILAFVGAGYDINHPTYGDTIRKALLYLIYRMNASGEFDRAKLYEGYNQGVCTMALCDAYRLMGDVSLAWPGGSYSLREKAELAVQGTIDMQNPTHGALPYLYRADYNDNSANAWGWQAIASADGAGLADMDQDPLASRIDYYFQNCNDDSYLGTGGAGYGASGLTPGRGFMQAGLNSESPWRATAAILACRLLTGHRSDGQDCQDQLDWLRASGYSGVNGATAEEPDYMAWATRDPAWHPTNRNPGYYDLYVTYYTTIALYQIGGQEWTNWIETAIPHLIDLATAGDSDEEEYYHEDLTIYGEFAGHVYSSALAAMVLEMSSPSLFPGSRWYVPGEHSYGYNKNIACGEKISLKPAADTIALMDYTKSGIDPSDPIENIAPRHGGKANVLFADGHVESFTEEELTGGGATIKPGMLTLEPGD